jgi:hypothetical protein
MEGGNGKSRWKGRTANQDKKEVNPLQRREGKKVRK